MTPFGQPPESTLLFATTRTVAVRVILQPVKAQQVYSFPGVS
jgi:hypothetical protein